MPTFNFSDWPRFLFGSNSIDFNSEVTAFSNLSDATTTDSVK